MCPLANTAQREPSIPIPGTVEKGACACTAVVTDKVIIKYHHRVVKKSVEKETPLEGRNVPTIVAFYWGCPQGQEKGLQITCFQQIIAKIPVDF